VKPVPAGVVGVGDISGIVSAVRGSGLADGGLSPALPLPEEGVSGGGESELISVLLSIV